MFAKPFDRGRNANPQLDIRSVLTLIPTQMFNFNKNASKPKKISWKDTSTKSTRNAKRLPALSVVGEIVEFN
jgi:hypothetical protein